MSLDQCIPFPPQLDQLDQVGMTISQAETAVCYGNVVGRGTDGALLAEEGIPFGLYDPGSCGISSHRISAHDETRVVPRVVPAEVMGPDAMKQRGQHHQNIKAGLALDMRQMPDGAKVLAGIAVVLKRPADEHDVILEECPEP